MKIQASFFVLAFAFLESGAFAQAITQASKGEVTPVEIKAIPVDEIPIKDCPNLANSTEIIMKFSGIRIEKNGNLRLRRNIKFKPSVGDEDSGPDVPEGPLTPFDIVAGIPNSNRLLPVRIVVKKGVGAKFISEERTLPSGQKKKFGYIRAGAGQGNLFCGLTPIVENDERFSYKFFVLPGVNAGYAIGIIVPEVNDDMEATGKSLPLIIDPNVKNEG